MDFPRSAFRRDFQYSTFNVHWPVARLNQPRHVRRSLSHRARLPREQTGRVFTCSRDIKACLRVSPRDTKNAMHLDATHLAELNANRESRSRGSRRRSESRKRKVEISKSNPRILAAAADRGEIRIPRTRGRLRKD